VPSSAILLRIAPQMQWFRSMASSEDTIPDPSLSVLSIRDRSLGLADAPNPTLQTGCEFPSRSKDQRQKRHATVQPISHLEVVLASNIKLVSRDRADLLV
jgi:hypothetical protein